MEYSAKFINRDEENGNWRMMGLLIYKLDEHIDISNLSIYLDQVKLKLYPKE